MIPRLTKQEMQNINLNRLSAVQPQIYIRPNKALPAKISKEGENVGVPFEVIINCNKDIALLKDTAWLVEMCTNNDPEKSYSRMNGLHEFFSKGR